VTIIVFITK